MRSASFLDASSTLDAFCQVPYCSGNIVNSSSGECCCVAGHGEECKRDRAVTGRAGGSEEDLDQVVECYVPVSMNASQIWVVRPCNSYAHDHTLSAHTGEKDKRGGGGAGRWQGVAYTVTRKCLTLGTHMRTRMHTHTHTCTRMRTCVHAHAHTRTHMHTHGPKRSAFQTALSWSVHCNTTHEQTI